MGLAMEYFLADTEDMQWLKECFDENGKVIHDDKYFMYKEEIRKVLLDRSMITSKRDSMINFRKRWPEDYN